MRRDVSFHLLEGQQAGGLALIHRRNVKTERGPEDWTDASDGEIENSRIEFTDHLAAWKPAQIAAVAGTVGIAVRNIGKRGSRLQFRRGSFDRRARGLLI